MLCNFGDEILLRRVGCKTRGFLRLITTLISDFMTMISGFDRVLVGLDEFP